MGGDWYLGPGDHLWTRQFYKESALNVSFFLLINHVLELYIMSMSWNFTLCLSDLVIAFWIMVTQSIPIQFIQFLLCICVVKRPTYLPTKK